MNIISRATLECAKKDYPNARKQLDRWYEFVRNAQWDTPDDLKKQYPNASILSENRVVFNIGGNSYRLLVKISYPGKQVLLKWFGTHAEYDKKKF